MKTKVLIGDKAFDPEEFCERYDFAVALSVLHDRMAEDHTYEWKHLRDAECALLLLMGRCFECFKPATHVLTSRSDDTYRHLRCEACMADPDYWNENWVLESMRAQEGTGL